MANNKLDPVTQAKVDEATAKTKADSQGKSSKDLKKQQKNNDKKIASLEKEKTDLESKSSELSAKIQKTTDDKEKLKLLNEKDKVDRKLEKNAENLAVANANAAALADAVKTAEDKERADDNKKQLDDFKKDLDGLSSRDLQAEKAKISPSDPLKKEKEAIIDQTIKDVEAEEYREDITDLPLDKLEGLKADPEHMNSLSDEKKKVLDEEIAKKQKQKDDEEAAAEKKRIEANQKKQKDEREDNINESFLYKGQMIPNFNFVLRVEFAYDIPCKSVRAFTKKNAYEHIVEGGVNDYVLLKRKQITEPFEFQIERYASNSLTDPLANGAELTAPVFLVVKFNYNNDSNSAGGKVLDTIGGEYLQKNNARVYMFTGCVVTGKEYGELNAERPGLLTETVTISYREMYVMPNLLSLGG